MTSPIPFKARLVGLIAWRLRPAWIASLFKRLIHIEPIQIKLDCGTLWIDPVSHLGRQLTVGNGYEPELTEYFRRSLRAGDTFVDIGANEGYFSVLAGSLVGSNGRIIAVEPQQRIQKRLRENFAANQMLQAQIYPVAISDHPGQSVIYLTPDMNSGATGLSRVTMYQCTMQEVELVTLYELLSKADLTVVDLMKMDIEGFEYEAILGSKDVFRKHQVKRLAVEFHPGLLQKRGLSLQVIRDFLHDQGYRCNECGSVQTFSLDPQ